MVRIPHIRIPSVRVGSIDPTSDIGTAIGGVQPTPITYLTQWKISGNSEVKTLPYPDGVVLPNGYKRCEYLESDGTAYIEVPFGFDKTDELYAKIASLVTAINDIYFVCSKTWNDNNNRFGMGIHSMIIDEVKAFYFCIAYGTKTNSSGFLNPLIEADINVHEWRYSNYTYTLENSSIDVSSSTFGSETQNLRLFYGYNKVTKCRIYEYRHKKGNTEYRLIPCLDSNNTPCMYDVINNQAYYNSADSGSFTYELYPQPTEIWSCGEYNPIDGKYHILIQPQGGSIADIALTEPLRKVNNVADTIEFPSETEGKALVTRSIYSIIGLNNDIRSTTTAASGKVRWQQLIPMEGIAVPNNNSYSNLISTRYPSSTVNRIWTNQEGCVMRNIGIELYDEEYCTVEDKSALIAANANTEFIYELATPTTELIDAPQIEEAESYTCVISPGAKAVGWSSFTTDSSE